MAGSPSPMWPMISLSRGCRSSAPESASRNTWIATSECQPQPAMRSVRGGHRQMSESGKAIGMRLHRVRQPIVDRARKCDALSALDQIGSRPRERKDLHTDAGFFHLGDPLLAHVRQLISEEIDEAGRESAARYGF